MSEAPSDRVEVTKLRHLALVYETLGMLRAESILTKLKEQHKLAGLALACATIAAAAQEAKSELQNRNIRVAIKAGLQFADGSLAWEEKDGKAWLVAYPDDPDAASE